MYFGLALGRIVRGKRLGLMYSGLLQEEMASLGLEGLVLAPARDTGVISSQWKPAGKRDAAGYF